LDLLNIDSNKESFIQDPLYRNFSHKLTELILKNDDFEQKKKEREAKQKETVEPILALVPGEPVGTKKTKKREREKRTLTNGVLNTNFAEISSQQLSQKKETIDPKNITHINKIVPNVVVPDFMNSAPIKLNSAPPIQIPSIANIKREEYLSHDDISVRKRMFDFSETQLKKDVVGPADIVGPADTNSASALVEMFTGEKEWQISEAIKEMLLTEFSNPIGKLKNIELIDSAELKICYKNGRGNTIQIK
jgi:hypothetical protein